MPLATPNGERPRPCLDRARPRTPPRAGRRGWVWASCGNSSPPSADLRSERRTGPQSEPGERPAAGRIRLTLVGFTRQTYPAVPGPPLVCPRHLVKSRNGTRVAYAIGRATFSGTRIARGTVPKLRPATQSAPRRVFIWAPDSCSSRVHVLSLHLSDRHCRPLAGGSLSSSGPRIGGWHHEGDL